MDVVVIEKEAFYKLIDEVVGHLSEKYNRPVDKWIDGDEAMRILRIKSTSLQKLRDEGKIEFSKINAKTILYNRFSIDEFIEKNKRSTF